MSKKPVHEIRLGRIKAAIWENETENGSRHNVSLSRLYKDDADNWKDSGSFGRDDLPLYWFSGNWNRTCLALAS